MPKGNQNPSAKGGGEGEHQRCTRSALKAWISSSMSTKLTMSRLNSHDSLQRTSNVKNIRSIWWRNSSSSSIYRISRRLTISNTYSRRRRGCSTRGLNLRAFRARSQLSSPLSKKGGTYGSYCVYVLRSGEVI